MPDEIRQRFKTSGSVQLIVDGVTANYPFELLTAPRPGRRFSRQALAVSGSVLRQFTETGQRRLSVHRATERSALVIGAGNVKGQNALPAADAEAESVHAALIDDERYAATLLHDKTSELDLIELSNELFGNHRILHIASHGEYEEGKPELTGAILSSQYLLTVDTVRVLRWVPDLVFLNCCSLGRIGLPRLAAGLAREFIAIGTLRRGGRGLADRRFGGARLCRGFLRSNARRRGIRGRRRRRSHRGQRGERRRDMGGVPVLRRPCVRSGRPSIQAEGGDIGSDQPG